MTTPPSPSAAAAPPVVLVVDDDDGVRTLVAAALREAGYAVRTARNGMEGIQHLCEPPCPSLIVLDLRMPVMNGAEFVRIQQGYLRWSLIPVVVLSALAPDARPPALDGATYLQKPVDVDALVGAIRARCPWPR